MAKVNNNRQWLQIDLGAKAVVKRISTQARYDANQWVTSYTVSYSNNGVRFYPYREGRRTRVCKDSLCFSVNVVVVVVDEIVIVVTNVLVFFLSW